jgi:hypothetical protein
LRKGFCGSLLGVTDRGDEHEDCGQQKGWRS